MIVFKGRTDLPTPVFTWGARFAQLCIRGNFVGVTTPTRLPFGR